MFVFGGAIDSVTALQPTEPGFLGGGSALELRAGALVFCKLRLVSYSQSRVICTKMTTEANNHPVAVFW